MKLRLRVQLISGDDRVLAQVDVDNVPDNMGHTPAGLAIHPQADRWKRVYIEHVLRAAVRVYEAATGRIL